MRQSEHINELAAALAKAQGMIEGAVKESVNPHFRNKYADLGNVWSAIREPLTSNGLSVVQLLRGVERGVECETILMHSGGQYIAESLFMPASKNDAQGYGSAATYARRYGLQAMVGIAPVDDDGEAARGRGDDRRDDHGHNALGGLTKPSPSVERGTPIADARREIDNGTASTVPQNVPSVVKNNQRDPKAFAHGNDARDFLVRAKTDLATIVDGQHLAQWRNEFAWEIVAIHEHASDKRNDFLNDLIADAQDRCRGNVLAAG